MSIFPSVSLDLTDSEKEVDLAASSKCACLQTQRYQQNPDAAVRSDLSPKLQIIMFGFVDRRVEGVQKAVRIAWQLRPHFQHKKEHQGLKKRFHAHQPPTDSTYVFKAQSHCTYCNTHHCFDLPIRRNLDFVYLLLIRRLRQQKGYNDAIYIILQSLCQQHMLFSHPAWAPYQATLTVVLWQFTYTVPQRRADTTDTQTSWRTCHARKSYGRQLNSGKVVELDIVRPTIDETENHYQYRRLKSLASKEFIHMQETSPQLQIYYRPSLKLQTRRT